MITRIAVLGFVLAAAACGSDEDARPGDDLAKPVVAVGSTGLGDVLVDGDGRTLYLFTRDSAGTSVCEGSCVEQWPPLIVSSDPGAGQGADQAKVGTITRSNGERQVTYAGKPLYRYKADAKPGDTKGHGVNGVWFAVTAAGEQVPAGTTTTTARGYDY